MENAARVAVREFEEEQGLTPVLMFMGGVVPVLVNPYLAGMYLSRVVDEYTQSVEFSDTMVNEYVHWVSMPGLPRATGTELMNAADREHALSTLSLMSNASERLPRNLYSDNISVLNEMRYHLVEAITDLKTGNL